MNEDIKEQEAWEQEKTSVTLTNGEWVTLLCYILASTRYRQGEQEACERLSAEKNEDGSPTFKDAADNAEFWKDTNATLERIKGAIEAQCW